MRIQRGFTLVELLVVIAVISLITTIAVVSLGNARTKSRDSKRVADIQQIQKSLELFFNDKGRYPTITEWNTGSIFSTSSITGTTTYLAMIPTAPSNADGPYCNASNSSYYYSSDSLGSSYNVRTCLGGGAGTNATSGIFMATPDVSGTCGTISILDQYGNSYNTLQIGYQCWLKQNMNIGTRIDSVASSPCISYVVSSWTFWNCQNNDGAVEKYCYNNAAGNCGGGALYEWSEALGIPSDCKLSSGTTDNNDGSYSIPCPSSGTVNISAKQQGICPVGWHIPNSNEWADLTTYLVSTAGTKIKAPSPYWDGSNTTNFTAMPFGGRSGLASFNSTSSYAFFWSNRPYSTNMSTGQMLITGNTAINAFSTWRSDALSVRCIKD